MRPETVGRVGPAVCGAKLTNVWQARRSEIDGKAAKTGAKELGTKGWELRALYLCDVNRKFEPTTNRSTCRRAPRLPLLLSGPLYVISRVFCRILGCVHVSMEHMQGMGVFLR